MIFAGTPPVPSPLRAAIGAAFIADERTTAQALLPDAEVDAEANSQIAKRAGDLVIAVREQSQTREGLDAFMHEYDLSSEEGVILMCLAEALLRIPDADTADKLIGDKLARGQRFLPLLCSQRAAHFGRHPVTRTDWRAQPARHARSRSVRLH